MKRTCSLLLCLVLLTALCACGQDVGVIGSADGPTAVIVSDQKTPAPQPTQPAPPPAAPVEPAAPALPTVSGEMDPFNRTWVEMQSADFWIALCDDPQAILMTAEEIADYNASLSSTNGTKVEKLSAWPPVLYTGRHRFFGWAVPGRQGGRRRFTA